MTELHAGLERFRTQLRDAAARDLARPETTGRPSRRTLALALPTAALAAAAATVLSLSAGTPVVPGADAAIMRHVVAATTPPPDTILHERALVTRGSTTQPYEVWIETGGAHAYRVTKWGHEGTGTQGSYADPAQTLRAMARSGHARLDGATTFDGVPAYELTVSGAPDPFLNGTAYVSRADYHPLLIDTTGAGGERIAVQVYEYLPPTPGNLALVR